MLTHSLRKALGQAVARKAKLVSYRVADSAPSDRESLQTHSRELVIWSGASDNTVFLCPSINHAFRAIHDALHIQSGLGFTIPEEIELGRIQANQFDGILSNLVYNEIAGQAEYFKKNGIFVSNQLQFAESYLKTL